jgi:hypothetical protein
MMTSTLSLSASARPVRRSEPEWAVVVVVVVALIAGWVLKTVVESERVTFSGGGVTLEYPAGWVRENNLGAGILFRASDMRSGSLYPTNVTLAATEALPQLPVEPGAAVLDRMTPALTAWSFQRGQELTAFRVLDTAPAGIAGRDGAALHYAYVTEPLADPFRQALPVVVEAMDYLIPVGERTIVLTVAADGAQFQTANARHFQAILTSVRLLAE